MSVKLIMFNNGLQIMGDVVEPSGEASITVTKPVQLVMVPPQDPNDKKMGMVFSPFLQYTQAWGTDGLTFAVRDILTAADPVTELMNSYNTAFGSGLVLPPGINRG